MSGSETTLVSWWSALVVVFLIVTSIRGHDLEYEEKAVSKLGKSLAMRNAKETKRKEKGSELVVGSSSIKFGSQIEVVMVEGM